MRRLLIHVEGQTEETFVNEVLRPHLSHSNYSRISARLIGNVRQKERRGGIRGWPEVRGDIVKHLKEDPGCIASTMVDYYGLPRMGSKAWPGRDTAGKLPFSRKADTIQDSLLSDISQAMGPAFNPRRFIPYVMMHEFEGLLFSDCGKFSQGIGHPELAGKFQAIRDEFDSPEEINDSPTTAPSKRIESLAPDYQKPLFGSLAVIEIGLDAIRGECPYFCNWLDRLAAE